MWANTSLSWNGLRILRQRLWADLAGKADSKDPTRIIRPEGEALATLINAAVRLSRHEAMVLGLVAPAKNEIVASVVGRTLDYEELGAQWDRLTPQGQIS